MASSSIHQQLADALRERIAVIGNRELRDRDPAAQLEQLKSVSEKIIRLQSQLPPDTHPQLRHFLERSSYDKALTMLDGMLNG